MLFGLPAQARLLFTLSLAQAGEFGFFLLGFAAASRVLSQDQAATLLLVIALSMLADPGALLAARPRSPGGSGRSGRDGRTT